MWSLAPLTERIWVSTKNPKLQGLGALRNPGPDHLCANRLVSGFVRDLASDKHIAFGGSHDVLTLPECERGLGPKATLGALQ